MPPPPPPDEVCERAWELYAHRGWRKVAQILTEELGRRVSHETARQWGFRGKRLYMTKKDLDPNVQRYRTADGLEQLMHQLLEAALDPVQKVSILDVADHFKWIYRERARLIGTDFQPKDAAARSGKPVEPQEFIQHMLGLDPEEAFSDPNGHHR